MLRTTLLLTVSAFTLSACMGSSNDATTTPTTPVVTTPTETMPTAGSLDYAGAVNFYGDGTSAFPGQMSMRANFNATGGTVTNGVLTLTGVTGTLNQRTDAAFTGTSFTGMALDGTLTDPEGTITSGGENAVLAAGQFRGTDAGSVAISFSGRVTASDDDGPQVVNAQNNADSGGILTSVAR